MLLKRKDLQPNTYPCKLQGGDFFGPNGVYSPPWRGAEGSEAGWVCRLSNRKQAENPGSSTFRRQTKGEVRFFKVLP